LEEIRRGDFKSARRAAATTTGKDASHLELLVQCPAAPDG